MKVFKFLIVILASSVKCRMLERAFLGNLPMENPDLFGGDMLGIEDYQVRSATVNEDQLWPGGVVPYAMDPGSSRLTEIKLEGAIDFFKKDTCIRFVPRTNEANYIRIFSGEGCYSHVGMAGGAQPLSLGTGCDWMGTVIHELNHALGFYHEQNRSDRDEYLIIYWDNIQDGMTDQFFKLKSENNQLLTPFDFDSLMLYGSYTFSKDRLKLKTMLGKEGQFLQDVRSKYRLSKSDIKRINMLYNCSEKQ